MYCSDLDQIFRVGRQMGEDDKSYILFAVTQGSLLWYPVNFSGKNSTLIDTTFILLTGVS